MSAVDRIRHEVREIGLVTLYFLICFLLFLSLKALLLDEYGIETPVLSTAVVGALVVAKVVVLVGKTSFGDRFRSSRLFVHILWRSLLYTAVVFAVTLLERAFDLYRTGVELTAVPARVWAGEDVDHFLALNLSVGLSLLVYNAFAEIGRHLGEDTLGRLLFSRRGEVVGRSRGAAA